MSISAHGIAAVVILGAATASVSLTLAYAEAFAWMRNLLARVPIGGRALQKLFQCPYCLSHWVGLAAVLAFGERAVAVGEPWDAAITTLLVVVAAAPISWIVFNAYAE